MSDYENRETRWPKADGVSLEPVTSGDELLDPRTGELLPATPDNAAAVWAAADAHIRNLTALKADCVQVLVEESRVRGTKTLHLADYTAVISGGPTRVYDGVELAENLRTVGCPEERIDALVTPVITYKVNANVRRQLAGANEDYASAIELASHVEEKPWRATVK